MLTFLFYLLIFAVFPAAVIAFHAWINWRLSRRKPKDDERDD
jgi:hypothetical protein